MLPKKIEFRRGLKGNFSTSIWTRGKNDSFKVLVSSLGSFAHSKTFLWFLSGETPSHLTLNRVGWLFFRLPTASFSRSFKKRSAGTNRAKILDIRLEVNQHRTKGQIGPEPRRSSLKRWINGQKMTGSQNPSVQSRSCLAASCVVDGPIKYREFYRQKNNLHPVGFCLPSQGVGVCGFLKKEF